LLAYSKQPGQTILNKTHPLISMIGDVAKNRDYYGYEIRNPNANVAEQAGQVAKYVVKSFEPFWTRGARKNIQSGAGAAGLVAPYFGTMPAPAYVTKSATQNRISELYHLRTGEPTKPYEKQFAAPDKKKAHDTATMDIYMFKRLPASDQDALRAKMTPEELKRYPARKAITTAKQ
jgi:hypothetical protein